jgi:hypothetical protein
MRDLADHLSIERIAREMINFDEDGALDNARERADEEARVGNAAAAERWRAIADTIERMRPPVN